MRIKFGLLLLVLSLILSCAKPEDPIIGSYALEVSSAKTITSGTLDIVGEPEDYFGRIVFNAKKPRVYEIGLTHKSEDSLHFMLPGSNGFLGLKKQDSIWQGQFKYFGIKADLKASKTGEPAQDLQDLVALKPLAKGTISTDQEESFPSYDSKNNILYFTRDQKLWSSQWLNEEWQTPQQLVFSQSDNDIAPCVYNDGESLLFSSNRLTDSLSPKKKNIWTVHKTNDAWGTPVPFPTPINIDSIGDYHPSISKNGTIYFVSYNRTGGFGRSDIYKAMETDSGDFEVSNLGTTINSALSEADVHRHQLHFFLN